MFSVLRTYREQRKQQREARTALRAAARCPPTTAEVARRRGRLWSKHRGPRTPAPGNRHQKQRHPRKAHTLATRTHTPGTHAHMYRHIIRLHAKGLNDSTLWRVLHLSRSRQSQLRESGITSRVKDGSISTCFFSNAAPTHTHHRKGEESLDAEAEVARHSRYCDAPSHADSGH